MRCVDLPNAAATTRLGHCMARGLFPGAVIGLVGPLGAGKTYFTRAIAEGLEIPDSRIVTSPTFVLIQEYEARLPMYHFDTYRLASETAFAQLGIHEYFEGDGVCLVEWADLVPGCMPMDYLCVNLEVTGEHSRRASIHATGQRHSHLELI